MLPIEGFYSDFINDLLTAQKDSSNSNLSNSFLEEQCSFLIDQDVLQNYHIVNYNSNEKNCRVDAWGIKPAIEASMENSLVLILSDFRETEQLQNQTLSSFRSFLEKGKIFFLNSLKDNFRLDDLRNENDQVKSLSDYIAQNRLSLYDITIIGLTNTLITSRSNTLVISEMNTSDYLFHYDVWDLERFRKIQTSFKGRESVDIDFVNDYALENGIKALTADTKSPTMQSYLFVLPGSILYKMYEQWNERLLEQNPRTFLQFTGKVNKGLKKTLTKAPDRFFCYNNGITAVASGVEYNNNTITLIRNFQIVNGGQTTASIFNCARNASKTKELFELDRVFVMVKMTVIEDDEFAKEIVPKISEYSNTQNKVSSYAFSIHHEYHKKMEEFSRKIWAPANSGEETHWYYERILGQYKNAITLCRTPSEKKLFEKQNPKNQMFKTVDLAKYVLSFDKHPDNVCLGAQKCYAIFCRDYLKADKESEEEQVYNGYLNEELFKENCVKAMIYKALEKRQSNGVRFVSVPYIIACVINNLEKQKLSLDYQAIWKLQWKSTVLFDEISKFGDIVISLIVKNMPAGTPILSEWAKKPDCWANLKKLELDTSKTEQFCLPKEMYQEQKKDQKKEKQQMNEAEAQIYVFNQGIPYWCKVQNFVANNNIGIEGIQASILNCIISGKIISGKQANYLVKLESKVKEEGFEA